jgi:hypothetical protein
MKDERGGVYSSHCRGYNCELLRGKRFNYLQSYFISLEAFEYGSSYIPTVKYDPSFRIIYSTISEQ